MSTITDINANRKLPWAGLGSSVNEAVTAEQAIQMADLDWNVELRNLYTTKDSGKTKIKISDRKAVVRVDTDTVFGTVGGRYEPFQNREVFAFADSLVADGSAKFVDAGSYNDGKIVFAVMKFPETVNVGGADQHDMYLLLRAGHNGAKSIGAYVTPVRIACTNAMPLVARTAQLKWNIAHTLHARTRLMEAAETLRLSQNYAAAFDAEVAQLMATPISDEGVHRLLTSVVPVKPTTDTVIEQIETIYRESPTVGFNGTAWGALNALTEYYQHGRETRSQQTMLINLFDGEMMRIRDRATRHLLAA